MINKKVVAILLDPEDDEEEPVFCTYNLNGDFKKLRDFSKTLTNQDFLKSLKQFYKFDLPYITYHDANPFELIDDNCDSLHTRIFRFKDAVLERDTIIGNDIGFKHKKDRIEKIGEHFYLPGKPDLIWESYPYFKPDIDTSVELDNKEYHNLYVKKFENLISKKFKQLGYDDELINLVNDIVTLQSPVEYQSYFTLHSGEFFDVFQYKIFQVIIKTFKVLKIMDEVQLRKYFNDTDESYHPVLNESDNVSLKPIGSVATSPFAFGISDKDTQFLNALLVHVELVHMSLGIGEGYELYFKSLQKQNFQDDKIHGLESTKINNFLKYFTKCVSICLNSKTNRFIILDYYWIGVFEIEDIYDGEIEDVKKLISKVKVRHFSYSNFENDENLSIRSIIGSFFNISSTTYHKINSKMDLINKRIVKDWELFQKSDSLIKRNDYVNPIKRFKPSPFTYSTPTGIKFVKQKVDLEKSLIKFIAIGYDWSCQTLSVNLKKLFQDKLHYSHLNIHDCSTKEVLISIYDQQYDQQDFNFNDYYRYGNRLINSMGNNDSIFGSLSQKQYHRSIDESYLRWISSVDVYNKLQPLQGDVIAKVIDYGYLEDKPYNNGKDELHFKTDGYYIIYEPISVDFEDMMSIDIKDETHFHLAKETLAKIHKFGVSINPHARLTSGVLRYYKGKIYIINLEEANTVASETHKNKDFIELHLMFNKNNSSLVKNSQRGDRLHKSARNRRASQSLEEHLFYDHDGLDDFSDSDGVDEDSAIY